MTFDEFIAKIYGHLKDECWITLDFLNPDTHLKPREARSSYENDLSFSVTWSLGGTAGNCWDDEKSTVSGEAEPDGPAEFDKILEVIHPNMTFLQYKGIAAEVMKRGEKHHGDYYGGSTTEAFKGFKVIDLYNALKKRGLV